MDDEQQIDTGRRLLLSSAGASAGLLLANGGLPSWLLNNSELEAFNYSQTIALLDSSMSELQRSHTVLPWHHPTRQVTNTVAIHNAPHIGTLFNANQIALIRHLYNLNLSQQGVDWFRNTIAFEGKFEGSVFKIFTDASSGNLASAHSLQTMINGGHYMLRDQASSNDAYVFGGPISYGQQIGNGRYQVQGNAFKAHGDAVHDFHKSLSFPERLQAYETSPPAELVTQIQGPGGQFSGLSIGATSIAKQELFKEALSVIFTAYTDTQKHEAFAAIEHNGGLESLHLSLYSDFSYFPDGQKYSALGSRERRESAVPYAQVWRIEGPACVIHFKGYPHVHAYINIVKEPAKIAIGKSLTTISSVLQGAKIGRFFIDTMTDQTGEEFAFYHSEYLGRLSPGVVSVGSIYALEPYDNKIEIVTMMVDHMTDQLTQSLAQQGANLQAGKLIRFATIDYLVQQKTALSYHAQGFKSIEKSGLSMRKSMISYLQAKPQALSI
jgi:hypothetical protein